jgi:hypothetical protein
MTTAIANPNLAFIKFTLAKLDRTDGKDNTGAKDLSRQNFCPGVSPVFSNSLNISG